MNKELEEQARAYLMNAMLTPKQIAALEKIGYFTAPAAMRHHLNRPQGLSEHSINVTNKMLEFKAFELRESCYRVGMLHDVVKCLCYRAKEKDGKTTYGYVQPPYPGHGVCSALVLDDLEIRLTPEERAAIVWHMGVYGMDEVQLRQYEAAKLLYPRAILLTHTADCLATAFEKVSLSNEAEEEEEGK